MKFIVAPKKPTNNQKSNFIELEDYNFFTFYLF